MSGNAANLRDVVRDRGEDIDTVAVPEVAPVLRSQAAGWQQQAAAITVSDQASYEAAAAFLNGCRTFRQGADEKLRPAIDAAHKAHKAMLKVLADIIDPVATAEDMVRQKTTKYVEEQRRREQELQRKAEAEARALAAKMEAERLAAIEAARLAREVELERELEAREAAGASRQELADVIETAAALAEPDPELPVYVPAPVVAPLVNTLRGAALTYNYSAQVTNLGQLIKAAAANPALEAYLQPNLVALNAIARAQKEQMRIPGVAVQKKANVR